MDYQKTVNHIMSFLKEKGVCSSSRKSHQECYAALGEYLQTTGEQYNETVRDAWFSVMKTKYSSNKCVFWEQYIFQFEEMASTGSISDRRLYQNKSAYDKLPFSIKVALDRYLSECGNRYTARTQDITKIECSMFLLALSDYGITKIEEIDFQCICKFVKSNYCVSHFHPVSYHTQDIRLFRQEYSQQWYILRHHPASRLRSNFGMSY